MRVNLEGDPVERSVTEIEVEDNIILSKGDDTNTVYVDLEGELDIHQVNRLIKGLELAKKVFNLEGE